MWKCPCCEAMNNGDVCVVCNNPKPDEQQPINNVYAPTADAYAPYSSTQVPPTAVPPTAVPPTAVPPYMPISPEMTGEVAPVKKKKKKTGLIITLSIVAVLIIAALSTFGYLEYSYSSAKDLLNDGKFDKAYRKFSSISFYRDSDTMKKECRYKEASDLLLNKKYDEAKDTYLSLGAYKDSQYLINECDYQKATELLNNKSYDEALDLFTKIKSHKDSATKITEIEQIKKDLRYYQAVDDYRAGRYSQATTVFNDMTDKYDSRKYLTLIDAHNGNADVDELKAIIGFEDAAELLLKTHEVATEFLEGTWEGGGWSLEFSSGDLNHNDNFPRKVESASSYSIHDGIFYEVSNGIEYESCSITVIEKDIIEVHSYENNETHRMNR